MDNQVTKQKIVIAEDNSSLNEIYNVRLSALGYECFSVYDGAEALKVIEAEKPNLVLLDMMMPIIAGDEVLRKIRSHDWGKDVKVFIISNLNEADAPAGLRELGIEGYVVKANLSNDQLDQLVDKILKPAGQAEDVSLEAESLEVVSSSAVADVPVQPIVSEPVVSESVVVEPVAVPATPTVEINSLRSVIYPSTNLEADKDFWIQLTGKQPYFNQPYYTGFKLGDCELGLDPNAAKDGITYPVAYWKVNNLEAAITQSKAVGAEVIAEPHDVGEGVMMARLKDKSGNIFGLIFEP